MHRVELKGAWVSFLLPLPQLFLMHRVELKVTMLKQYFELYKIRFLMHRVELKVEKTRPKESIDLTGS